MRIFLRSLLEERVSKDTAISERHPDFLLGKDQSFILMASRP